MLDHLQMTMWIKLTSQKVKVKESSNIPNGSKATYKKSVEEESMDCNKGNGG